VDRESKLSNMFVFDFALLIAISLGRTPKFLALGIPVHGRVMKQRFQKYGELI